MASWTDRDAQARFGALLDRCLEEGPQTVTRDGQAAAILVPVEGWQQRARPSLKKLLLANEARIDLPLPHRRAKRRRGPTALRHKPSTS